MIPPPTTRGFTAWNAAALFAVLLVVYFPALRGGFVWDDERHVTEPALRSLSGLARIWFEPGATQQYYPILHSAFWLEHRLWGDATLGYHLASLTQHALAAALFGLVLRSLAVPGAALAAWLFAFHPTHVESVAWISEQKNTLSTVFYLAAALAYLHFDASRRAATYRAAFALFLLALLTKTVTATLPAALLVVLWWRRGHLDWHRDVKPLVPWLALGVVAGFGTAWLERALIGAEGAAFDLTLLERTLLAPRVVWFYLGKLFWPANLTFIYPRWHLDPEQLVTWLPLLGALGLLIVLWRLPSRAPLATALLFIGSLFPVLGFLNVYPFQYSFVADHFQYLASLPVIAAAAAGLAFVPPAARPAGGAIVLCLAALTWQQSPMYRDVRTLYRTTIARNPTCWMAHNNLGRELLAHTATQAEAIACFERALALRPVYWEARNNLGLALAQTGRPYAAIPHLETARQLRPHAPEVHNNLGIALARSGRPADAIEAFRHAAALNPALPNIQENWAKALLLLGRRAEADARFALAARLRTLPPR